MMIGRNTAIGALFSLILTIGAAAAAVPLAPGFSVQAIQTPGTATGDVVVVDGSVFVGVGSFGAGTQSVVRIDGGSTVVLAEGFNSLGGFAWDAVNQRLIVGDNGGNLPGATTGDTIYAIYDPFGNPASPAAAAGLEILPMGSIPGLADLVVDPLDPTGDRLFVSDASELFPVPDGRVLEVSVLGGSASTLHDGLAFAAGLAADGDSLYLGETLLDWSGMVSTVDLASPGDPLLALTGGLPGQYDLELGCDGSILATGGGEVLRIDPASAGVETLATGLGFATGLTCSDSTIYVLDGFAAAEDTDKIWALTPVPEPGAALLFGAGAACPASPPPRSP
jgi:sugar lactone lactonase YvrE